ncbi:MAG TPA: hypothetical protein VFZ34_25340 [Blastocatellia bacterium]|nr:hypothetical protein [Blastocatellia bacterium]
MKFISITAGIACVVILSTSAIAQTGSASAQTQASADVQVGQRKASAEAKQETKGDARTRSTGQEKRAQAQSQSNADVAGGANALNLAQGTQLQAVLKNTLDSKQISDGQQFLLKTTKDLKVGGQKVISKGSTLVGHVVNGQSKAEGNGKAEMTLLIDGVQQGEQMIPLQAMFVGVIQSMAQTSAATDFDSMPAMSSPAPRSGGGGLLGGGVVGGVTSTVSNTVGATTQTVGQVGGIAKGTQGTLSATNGITQNGNVTGGLMAPGQVLFSLQNGLTATTSSSVTGATNFARNGKDIKLEKGTEFVLAVTGSSKSSANVAR